MPSGDMKNLYGGGQLYLALSEECWLHLSVAYSVTHPIGNCLRFVFGADVYFPPQSGHTRSDFKPNCDIKLLPRISLPHIGHVIFGGIVFPRHLEAKVTEEACLFKEAVHSF